MEVGAKAGVARGRNASTDAKTTRKVRGIPPPHAKVVKATSPLKSSLQKAPRRGMRKAAPAKDVKVKDTLNDEVGYKQRSEKEVENGEDELHENINDVKARKGEEEEEDRERGKKKIGGAAKGKGDAKADNAGAGLRSAHTARTAGKADSKDATATLKKGTANTSAKDKKTTATRLPGETRLKRKQPLSSADAHAKTPEAVSVSGSAKNTCPAPKRQKTTDVAAPTAASARTTTASSRVRAKAGASTASQPVTKTTNTSSRTPASATKTIKAGSARAAKPLSLLQSAPRRSPVKQAQRLREPARSPVRKSPVRSQQVSPIKMAMSVETPLMKSKCGIEAGGLDFDKKSSNSETGLVAAEGDETVIENDIIDAEWEDMRNIDFRGDSVKRSPEKMLEALTAEDCSSPSPAKSVMSVQSTKSHRSIMSAKSLRFEVMEMGAYEEVRETRVTEEIKVVEDKEVSIAEELVKPEKLEEKETVVEENDIEDNVASPAPVTNTPATHASMPTPRPITPASTYKPTLLSKTPKFPAQSSSSSLFSNIKRMNNPPATAPQIRASSAAINNKMSNNNASTTPSSMMSPSRLLSGAASFIKAPFESVSITPFKAAPPVSRQTSASRSLFESIMRAPTEEREMFPISPTPKDVVSPEAEDDTETSEEDEDVPQTPCTAPQTATPAAMSTVKPTVVTPAMGAAPLRRNLLMTEPPVARPILKSAMKMPASVAPTRRLAFVDENVAAEFSDGERERLAAGSPIQKSAVKVVTFQTPATARKRREQQPSVNVYDDEHDMYNDETVNSMISNHQILEGAVFFVDVNSAEGADAGDLFIPLLTELGATCVPRWQNSLEGVTHVLFKDGQRRTLEKVSDSDGRIKCVNLGWALEYVSPPNSSCMI